MRSWLAVLAVMAHACATANPRPAFTHADASATRYGLGDWVQYRYTGAFTAGPVALREEVVAREGNRLRIDVTATRGDERREWVQVVTDTPENQRDNVIDALFERRGDRFVRLSNENNQDVLRLYEWVILMPDGRATDVISQACTKDIAGREFACTCTSGRNRWQSRSIRFEQSSCPDFLWTNGLGRFWDDATGENILRVDVEDVGRRSDVVPLPLEPRP